MAQWTQTLEPYIKVQESIKITTIVPTAGESLIIGVPLISDAGPSTPTLISGQKEFLSTFTSQDLTEDYIKTLDNLYTGENTSLASTMWSNAYRLAGSNTLLVTRAMKGDNIIYLKPATTSNDQYSYILRDGETLKKVTNFKIVLDTASDDANHSTDGWSININGVGILGNRTTDSGPQYDYYVNTLPDLVEQLNETPKFFSPEFEYYKSIADSTDSTKKVDVDMDNLASKQQIKVVVFKEVYLGVDILDKTDERTAGTIMVSGEVDTETSLPTPAVNYEGQIYKIKSTSEYKKCIKSTDNTYTWQTIDLDNNGMTYLITCSLASSSISQNIIDLNDTDYSGFVPYNYYGLNLYNSTSDLRVRIRRFNHDAVTSKEISDTATLTKTSNSPYNVLTTVLDIFTTSGLKEPSETVLARDFYEIAIYDKSTNDEVSFFNVGKISGRGDVEVSDVYDSLSMIQLNLPEDLHGLGLNYYGYDKDDKVWRKDPDKTDQPTESDKVNTLAELLNVTSPTIGTYKYVLEAEYEGWYKYQLYGETDQIFMDLAIDSTNTSIIKVSDSDLKKALDKISQNEVYTVEGLCDLGNTDTSFQSYMANMAINENYFYPISTANSTNYMTIGNFANKISQDSCKLYMSSPWDIDTGTLGWKFYASNGVLYWEAVARNRNNNNEFASILGQSTGIVTYQKPVVEFNKKTRQLLLSKKVNTVFWNIATQAWNMNDSYTKQSENNILGEDGNSRLHIRISKAIPSLLKQFIGKKITNNLCNNVEYVLNYFFDKTIMTMNYTVDAYQVSCQYDETLARQNKIKVVVNVRYSRSLKFIEVYNNAFDVGMDISNVD